MKSSTIYRGAAVLLLCAMGAQRYQALRRPVDVERYHAHVREAAAKVPSRIEGWIGQDVAVPVQAATLLQPNLMMSRQYLNVESGQTAGVLLVHCSDAHDMAGHFPLRCYPAQGWKLVHATPHDWQVGRMLITGMEYSFIKQGEVGGTVDQRNLIVANFLLRPSGGILRNMDQMMASIRGAGGQAAGAAQIQVYFPSTTPAADRERTVKALLGGYLPVIDAILSDPAKQ